MRNRTAVARYGTVATAAALVVAVLVIIALAVVAGGCSSGESGDTLTTASGTSVGPATSAGPTSTGITATTLPEVLSDWDRQLAETAQVQNQLAAYLIEQGAVEGDPRFAIIYGLRARTQAITARQALEKNDLELADMAMKDVYSTLNLGRSLAEGSTAQTLEEAHAIVATLGAPSGKPEEAATLLEQLIAGLAPLLDEARALVPSS